MLNLYAWARPRASRPGRATANRRQIFPLARKMHRAAKEDPP